MRTSSYAAELPERPVTSADEQVGLNAAIAAAVTRAVGSMPALYAVLVIVGGWMALATWGPLRRVDPYPFPFLLFLNNVVQLVLCSVILVGQRVLGMAADRRAVQTYESAEAIFAQVTDLQEHLDRQDRVLSRGVSLLESSPHPWIERHRVQPPPQATDQVVSLNGRIAARLTRLLGSMWTFYASALTQVAWIVLAEAGIQRFDRYPFLFMTFLSTLAQLIFMVVIMVGQDVLGHAADRRSEQTFLDAEAILHECRRMKGRLTAQDRVIGSLSGYVADQVTEHLARALHEGRATLDSGLQPRPWEVLPEDLRGPARVQARQLGEMLASIGCLMAPASGPGPAFTFTDEELLLLARLEHERWMAGQVSLPPADGPDPQDRTRARLVPWEQLPDRVRARYAEAARGVPATLGRVGFQVLRDERANESAGQADVTDDEWAILQQAIMAGGVLVSLAEGGVDADEILALVRKLREASISHPRRLIRELAAASTFSTGLRAGTRYADYEAPALDAIRAATAIIAVRAPADLPGFRAFLAEIATVVADANKEGGFLGVGARRRTPGEAAAIEAVSRATGLEG
ncbi:MAG: hypothetical protein JWM19_6223 [Actinomycetia bacterium]|nr:hypothetical protein [Actinomycetes bacterium]